MVREKLRFELSRAGVVVSIICAGLFLLLLFPYLLHSRAAARRTTCQHNLTQIGMSLANYGDVFESLPYGTQQNRELAPDKRLSWYPQIWPYIASDSGRLDLNLDESWDSSTNLLARAYIGDGEPPENALDAPLLVCPSMKLVPPVDSPGPTAYVGIAGVGTDAAELPLSDPRAGAWGYDRCTPLTRLTSVPVVNEGSTEVPPRDWTKILLLAETGHDNGPWSAGGLPTLRGLDPDLPQLIGPTGTLGGNHARGANIFIADYYQFMTNDMDTRVLLQLATIRGPAAD